MSNLLSVKEILRKAIDDNQFIDGDTSHMEPNALDTATQALKAQFIELTDRVIGEDEPLVAADPMQKRSLEIRRNDLRAEQRKTRDQLVKEYFDE